MFKLVRLKDGTYKLIVKYYDGFVSLNTTMFFKESEPSKAEIDKEIMSFSVRR